MNYSTIENYINTFDPINEGERDCELYNKGILLRTRFGLTGDDLVSALSGVNQTKCNPPLPENDVQRIAQSVDGADAPIGQSDCTFERTGQRTRKQPGAERRTWHCTCADAVSVDTLLAKMVSIYPNCQTNIPSGTLAISEVLETFKTGGHSRALIDAIRAETNEEKRKEMKRELPAFVFGSVPQTKRNNAACLPNQVICLDFDCEPKGTIPVGEVEAAKKQIVSVPYVFATGISASGSGVFALAFYQGKPAFDILIKAMQADFPYKIDPSRSDLCGLRYATLDPDMIIKDEVCPAVLSEDTEPMDDIDDTEPLPYAMFPVNCLPNTLAQWVRDAQRCINMKDPAKPAVSVLAVISSVIGSSCQIEIKRGYNEHAGLFTAVVADSGQAKSPSITKATDYLKALQAAKIKKWKREMYAWEQEYTAWKDTPKKQRGSAPMAPHPAERFAISDITIEAVAGILEINPLGVLLHREELNAFLGSMDAYKKAAMDLQKWIEIFDGIVLLVDRVTKGTTQVDNPSVSIIGGVQTGILRQTLKDRPDFIHSGFGSRFLFVMPEKEPIVWNNEEVNDNVVSAYQNLIDRILIDRESVLERDDTGIAAFATVKPFVFTLSAGAKKVLFAFQKRHAIQAVYENAANAAAMNKAGRIAARLCLTLHCVRSIEETGYLFGLAEVSKETAENTVAIADWFIGEAERVYAMLAGGQVAGELTAEQREVMKVLHGKDVPLTQRDINKASRVVRRMDNLAEVLRQLITMKKIRDTYRNGAMAYEIFSVPTVGVPKYPVNSGEYRQSGYGDTGDTPKNEFSDGDVVEGFGAYRNTEPSIIPADFAVMIRETLLREPPKNTVYYEMDILPYFDEDRAAASAFLHDHGFEVKAIDEELRVVETETPLKNRKANKT